MERNNVNNKKRKVWFKKKRSGKWIVEKLKTEEVKIIKGSENKEAAKVIFKNRKERKSVCERREKVRKKYDMMLDEWLTIEERKEITL